MGQQRQRIAIIGAGATSLYLLKNLLERADALAPAIGSVVLFERGDRVGTGMPYHPSTTDTHNLSNISSEELPRLQQTFADWLRDRSDAVLARFDLRRDEISETQTYARLALGEYFEAQAHEVIALLRKQGIEVELRLKTSVTDLRDEPEQGRVLLFVSGHEEPFDRVVIATGHSFTQVDSPEHGYFASPWPIHKILPAPGTFLGFEIGTLGASLSAFDVVSSLAHRHGRFEKVNGRLRFVPDPKADGFRLVMHSTQGWLPHLQYEQTRPYREVYHTVDRAVLLALRDDAGFLRLGTYFDEVCRPVLAEAFAKDRRPEVVAKLRDPSYTLDRFVDDMSAEHAYDDAFAGMKQEYPQACRSVRQDQPIHWKETLDDLMYTLSYHAELMPAEDHAQFAKIVMPFLMNVIAALPLRSADILLALHDAGRLDLQAGRVEIRAKRDGQTHVEIEQDGQRTRHAYRLFIDCSGQAPVQVETFPFPTLVKDGTVRAARVRFADEGRAEADGDAPDADKGALIQTEHGKARRLDGIDIDAAHRVIGADGRANPRILDICFSHTTGLRPYSYGLQACNHTAGVAVEAWAVEADSGRPPPSRTATLTKLHDQVPNEP